MNGILKSVRLRDVNADAEVVIKVNNINVIVTNRRKPYHYISDFENLDLKPKTSDIIIVKIGYLVPELYDIRGSWVMALTPGGVDQDLLRLDYKEIVRPIFPLDTDFNNPNLSAKLIPSQIKMEIKLTHIDNYHSKIENLNGNYIEIDNKTDKEPKGVSPMELLLMGVAGCSSIDIISI